MSILDEDVIGTRDPRLLEAYRLLAANSANAASYNKAITRHDEWLREVRQYFREKHGRDPNDMDIWHVLWRIATIECVLWGTTRGAIDDLYRDGTDIGNVPAPPTPQPPPVDQPPPPSTAGGGFVEPIRSGGIRPRLSRSEITTFLPERGAFMYPAPYNTRGVRVTNVNDGMVRPIGMSYWPNINNHVSRRELLVLTSLNDVLVLFAVDKTTGSVYKQDILPFTMTGESCYFSFTDPDVLYTCPSNGGTFIRYHIPTQRRDVIAENVKQPHSSADGRVHSFTMNGGPAIWRDGQITRFPLRGDYDECQVDKSGEWLVSKERIDDNEFGNRIIHLASGEEWYIRKALGGVGHSDMGYGYIIGEDNAADPGGVFRRWDFTLHGPVNGGMMYATDWTGMTRYVSHCNAKPGSAAYQQALYSGAFNGDIPRANEIVVAALNGTDVCRVLAPNLTDLTAPGGGDEYWRKTRANIDPPGQWYCFSGNMGRDRIDIFLGQV